MSNVCVPVSGGEKSLEGWKPPCQVVGLHSVPTSLGTTILTQLSCQRGDWDEMLGRGFPCSASPCSVNAMCQDGVFQANSTQATALLSSQILGCFPAQGSGLTIPSHRLSSAAQGG